MRINNRSSEIAMKRALICFVLFLCAQRHLHAQEQAKKPNIIFFLIDDLGYTDVGFNGGDIKTPNIDKLAKSGANLSSFYVQPVCSPTRAALMTGRNPMRHGLQLGVVRPWAQYGLPLEERTLAQALRAAGYKWHLGHFQRDYLPTMSAFIQSRLRPIGCAIAVMLTQRFGAE
jgi:hypothetical protein